MVSATKNGLASTTNESNYINFKHAIKPIPTESNFASNWEILAEGNKHFELI